MSNVQNEDMLFQALVDQVNQQRGAQTAAAPAAAKARSTTYVVGPSNAYMAVRGFLADALVVFGGMALWVLSAKYTAQGIHHGAEYMHWTWLANVSNTVFGYVICLAISALEQEFNPWWGRPDDAEPPDVTEIGIWLAVVCFGIWQTVSGAAVDLADRLPEIDWQQVGTLIPYVVLIVLASGLEVTPEPVISKFGGRMVRRLPFGGWVMDKVEAFKVWRKTPRKQVARRTR